MGTQKLSPQGRRLRIIILTVPIMAATSGSQLSPVALALPAHTAHSCSSGLVQTARTW